MSIKRIITEDLLDDKYSIIRYLEKKGYKVEQLTEEDWIGAGSYSKIYKIDNKKVLKITHTGRNEQEIEEYKKLVGKNNRNVVKVYHAHWRDLLDTGVVIMEYLHRGNQGFIFKDYFTNDIDINDIASLLSDYYIDYKGQFKDYKELIKIIAEDIEIPFDDWYEEGEKKDAYTFCRQVFNGIKELDEAGVHFNDIHMENIMQNRIGHYKIVDFYHS